MAGFLQRYLALCCADDKGAAGCFDHIIGDQRQAVDFQDAFDLHKQPVEKAEVAACDAGNRGDGLRIGEVGMVKRKAKLTPMPGQTKESSSPSKGR